MNKLQAGDPLSAAVSPERLAKLELMCSSWVSEGRTPALSVLAARRGIIFLHNSWGKLTPAPESPPVTNTSLVGMASCSKPVTAAAVLLLVEEGRIKLHQPLKRYLPEFDGPMCEKITIHHLLSHTSGLPLSSTSEGIPDISREVACQPGSKMIYSSAGYDLLGRLVERVSGISFDKFTRSRIFEPLGMRDTTFVHLGLDRSRCVQRRPGTTYDWPEEMEGKTSASSSLWSTAFDMAVFLQTFLNQGRYAGFQLLSEESTRAMTRDQTSGIPREQVNGVSVPAPGYGWFMLGSAQFPEYPRSFSGQSYGHSGASGAFIWADPEFDLLGAFLFVKVQEDFRPLDSFVDSLMDCIIDRPIKRGEPDYT